MFDLTDLTHVTQCTLPSKQPANQLPTEQQQSMRMEHCVVRRGGASAERPAGRPAVMGEEGGGSDPTKTGTGQQLIPSRSP